MNHTWLHHKSLQQFKKEIFDVLQNELADDIKIYSIKINL
jgi:hypothetical protein